MARLAIGAFLALGVGACSGAEEPHRDGLGVGDAIPAIGLLGDRPALVWVFDAKQCLGCELTDPARMVRGVQRRLGTRIETVVVAVVEQREDDRDIVTGFLASQRVSARVETRSRIEYIRDFGSAPLAAFYVTNGNSVIKAVMETQVADSWRSAPDSSNLVGFVERLVEEGESSAENQGTTN